MAKMSPEALKESFKNSVETVWEGWLNYTDSKTSPFKDSDEIMDSDMDNDDLRHWFSHLFYAKGVHDATGWSLHNPGGPKEWSPNT